MNEETEARSGAVAGPVERPVRPIAWCSRPNGGSFVSDEARNNVPIYREVYNVPLYGRADLDAAVAAERERCAKLCDSETLIQHGEFGAGWVEGAKACAALIRGPNVEVTGAQSVRHRRSDEHDQG